MSRELGGDDRNPLRNPGAGAGASERLQLA